MRTNNPVLSDKVLQQAVGTERDRDDPMTLASVSRATMVLLGLVIAGGVVGWQTVPEPSPFGGASLSGWTIVAALVALGTVIFATFKPTLSPVLGPIFAVAEGFFAGSLSRVYEYEFDGIVLQALALTVAISFLMLVLYLNDTIRATPKFRKGVMAATGAIFLVYVTSFVLGLFGVDFPYLHDSGPLGIGISLVIVGVAALNLILDLDLIERGCKQGWPRHMTWFAALSLVVTLVWLYLELLRLLAKLRD